MKQLELGMWVVISRYYRRIERQGVPCWEARRLSPPRRGVWIGSRDLITDVKHLWDGTGLRPFEGALAVQVVAVDKDHMPMWAPIENLEISEET